MRNIEIKAKIKQLLPLIEKAKSLSNSNGEKFKQFDTFYKTKTGRLKLRRFEGNIEANLIHYERPNISGPKTSQYHLTKIESDEAENLHKILSLSNGILGSVNKTRYLFLIGQTRVHIDSVDNLGDFVELEVVLNPDESEDYGQKIANKLMDSLGIDREDLVNVAYLELLEKKD